MQQFRAQSPSMLRRIEILGAAYYKANLLIKVDTSTVKVRDELVLFQPGHDTVVHGHEDEHRDARPSRRGR
jgi:hypothetical protein